MTKPIPHDVYRDACAAAEQAIPVSACYEDQTIYFVPTSKIFVMAKTDAGVKEIAEAIIRHYVTIEFSNTLAAEILRKVDESSGGVH
jgi:hypothetical protein